MLEVKKFTFSPFAENTYLVFDSDSAETAVIDPGCYSSEEENVLADFAEQNSLNIIYLINTHCHIDHIFGNRFVKEKFNPEFIAPEKDIFLLDLMVEQAKSYGLEMKPSPKPDAVIDSLKEIFLGKYKFEFIFTPGHTPGEYCLYCEEEKILFSGDVLFRQSIGRTDLWGGDYDTLINSIKNQLYTLPGGVKVYPGHESSTTIDFEKRNNPFVTSE